MYFFKHKKLLHITYSPTTSTKCYKFRKPKTDTINIKVVLKGLRLYQSIEMGVKFAVGSFEIEF